MADVFVSYASEDRQRVEALVRIIEDIGLTVWWDRHLLSGDEWDQVIQTELAKAESVLVVWTRHSINSNWVRTEALEGLERNILHPVLLDPVTIPLAFKRIHATDLSSTSNLADNPQIASLLSALANSKVNTLAIKQPRPHRRVTTAIVMATLAGVMAVWLWISIDPEEPDVVSGPIQVAVLPFRNLTPSQDLDWLAEGLAELLRGQINAWQNFVALPGALTYTRSIAELPDTTGYAIDGSLQLDGDQVTVRLDAIDVRSSNLLWTQTIKTSIGDPFELQRRISTRVAREFGESLINVVPPPVPEAFREFLPYLSLRGYGNPSEHKAQLQRILKIDPTWVFGWADLAWVLMRASSIDYRPDLLREGEVALQRARQLAPEDPSHWGWIVALDRMFFRLDLDKGEQDAAFMATNVSPTPYYMMMLAAGLYTDIEPAIATYTELAPFDAVGWELLSAARANLEDHSGAHEAALIASRLYPSAALLAQSWPSLYPRYPSGIERSETYVEQGQELLQTMDPTDLHYVGVHRWVAMVEFKLAMHLNDNARAAAAADRAGKHGAVDAAAMMYLRLNDPKADDYFAIATQGPSYNRFNYYHLTPLLTPELRSHPLVRAYEEAMGFTSEWRTKLCRRAAELPTDSGISCNPDRLMSRQGAGDTGAR